MTYLTQGARAAGLKHSQARTRFLVAVRQAEVRGQAPPLHLRRPHTPLGPPPETLSQQIPRRPPCLDQRRREAAQLGELDQRADPERDAADDRGPGSEQVSVGSLVGAVTGAVAITLLIRFVSVLGPTLWIRFGRIITCLTPMCGRPLIAY